MLLARCLNPMAIEIMVGLPHLREGPILNRARVMQARAEIRALIEERQLSHDEISQPWIAQWAADIFQVEPPAFAEVSQ